MKHERDGNVRGTILAQGSGHCSSWQSSQICWLVPSLLPILEAFPETNYLPLRHGNGGGGGGWYWCWRGRVVPSIWESYSLYGLRSPRQPLSCVEVVEVSRSSCSSLSHSSKRKYKPHSLPWFLMPLLISWVSCHALLCTLRSNVSNLLQFSVLWMCLLSVASGHWVLQETCPEPQRLGQVSPRLSSAVTF